MSWQHFIAFLWYFKSIEVEDETKQQKKDQKPMQKTQSVDSTGSGGGEKEEKLKYEVSVWYLN